MQPSEVARPRYATSEQRHQHPEEELSNPGLHDELSRQALRKIANRHRDKQTPGITWPPCLCTIKCRYCRPGLCINNSNVLNTNFHKHYYFYSLGRPRRSRRCPLKCRRAFITTRTLIFQIAEKPPSKVYQSLGLRSGMKKTTHSLILPYFTAGWKNTKLGLDFKSQSRLSHFRFKIEQRIENLKHSLKATMIAQCPLQI